MADLIEDLRQTLITTVAPLMRGARRVALVDFPNYHNVGDSALWLGALRLLEACGIERPVYVCDRGSYDSESLERRLGGDGMIVLSGGGNFGDVWEAHQNLRERVIRDFPHRRILQLPQSIHFESPERLARASAVLDAHPDLTLLVRDARSLAIARGAFRAPAILCPDLALALGRLTRPVRATRPIVWLSRRDREKAPGPVPVPPPGLKPIDWPRTPRTPSAILNRRLSKRLARSPRRYAWLLDVFESSCRRVARQRLDRACRLLASGRVVVTDRLHTHILCLLLDIPHYIADNSYGKVRGLHEAWTHASTRTVLCAGEADALQQALRHETAGRLDSGSAAGPH